MSTKTTVAEFPASSATVVSVDADEDSARRLMSMGIFRGQVVEIVRAGSNVILKAAGGRIAMGRELANQIIVEPTRPRKAA